MTGIFRHRDLFITCPSVEMASFWASSTRSAVYMYHLPQDMVHTRYTITKYYYNCIVISVEISRLKKKKQITYLGFGTEVSVSSEMAEIFDGQEITHTQISDI